MLLARDKKIMCYYNNFKQIEELFFLMESTAQKSSTGAHTQDRTSF